MAQDYDNIGKNLLTDHAGDIARFTLEAGDVEVLEDLDTEQQTVIARGPIAQSISTSTNMKPFYISNCNAAIGQTNLCRQETRNIRDTSSANIRCLSIPMSFISIREPAGRMPGVTPTIGIVMNTPVAIR